MKPKIPAIPPIMNIRFANISQLTAASKKSTSVYTNSLKESIPMARVVIDENDVFNGITIISS